MKTVTRRSIVGVCLLGLVAGACLSPTLPPLPPPGAPELSYVAPGQLQLSGMVSSRRSTRVIAVNNNNDHLAGEIVRDGTYSFIISAEPGHRLELWYEVGADVSESLFLTAPNYTVVSDPGAEEAGAAETGAPAPAASDAEGSDAERSDAGGSDAGAIDTAASNTLTDTSTDTRPTSGAPADDAATVNDE